MAHRKERKTDSTHGHAPCASPFVQKSVRCRLAGCPNADICERDGSPCSQCTGPVAWTDAKGVRHGRCRSCHGCPMNGLGLPVCWAACPGPNEWFAKDGEDIVSLGALEDPGSFVMAHRPEEERAGSESDGERRMFDEIDGADDGGGSGASASRIVGIGDGEIGRALMIAERVLLVDGRAMEGVAVAAGRNGAVAEGTDRRTGRHARREFADVASATAWARARCAAGTATVKEDAQSVADAIGCDVRSVRDEHGIARRIIERLRGLDAKDWDALRSRALGIIQAESARMMLVSKQAVSKREKRVEARSGLSVADAEIARASGVHTPSMRMER